MEISKKKSFWKKFKKKFKIQEFRNKNKFVPVLLKSCLIYLFLDVI